MRRLQGVLLLGFIFMLGVALASERAHQRDAGLTPGFENSESPESAKDTHRDEPPAVRAVMPADGGERPLEHTSVALSAKSPRSLHIHPPARAPPGVRSPNV